MLRDVRHKGIAGAATDKPARVSGCPHCPKPALWRNVRVFNTAGFERNGRNTTLDHDAETLLAENDALTAAEQGLRLVQANYQAGMATYLDVLNADAQFHQAVSTCMYATS